MTTLREILSGSFQYSNSWAVYSLLDEWGRFYGEQPARFGQVIFEDGGILDNYTYFASNIKIVDFLIEWDDADVSGAIDQLIEYAAVQLYIV